MPLEQIGDAEFEEQVLRSPLPVLVDFWADWCAPCRRLHPILERLAEEWAGRLRIVGLDIAANPTVPAQQGVLNLPSLVLYVAGKEVTRFGLLSEKRLCQRLEKVLRTALQQPPKRV